MNLGIVHVSASARRAHCFAIGPVNGVSRPLAGSQLLVTHFERIKAENENITGHGGRNAVVARHGRPFDSEILHDDSGLRYACQPKCDLL